MTIVVGYIPRPEGLAAVDAAIVEAERRGEFRDLPEPIGGAVHLLFRTTCRTRVYANAVTTKRLRGLSPFEMILDRLTPLLLIGIAEVALVVAHDEHIGDAFVSGDFP